MGKTPDEYLPQKEGWVWVSLDVEEVDKVPLNRLHLSLDANKDEDCQKISGLFDTVVVV